VTERIPNPTNQKVANPIGKNEAVQRVAEGVDEEARVREDVMTVAMTVVAIVVMTLVTTAVTIRKAVKRVAEVVVALTNDPVKDRMAAGDADVEMTIGMMCMSKKNVQPVTVRTMRMTAKRIVEGVAAAGVVGAVDEDAALKPLTNGMIVTSPSTSFLKMKTTLRIDPLALPDRQRIADHEGLRMMMVMTLKAEDVDVDPVAGTRRRMRTKVAHRGPESGSWFQHGLTRSVAWWKPTSKTIRKTNVGVVASADADGVVETRGTRCRPHRLPSRLK
jgi:hypothetical protein